MSAKHGDVWRSSCGKIELRCGDYRDVLADVERVAAVITDPPYGDRTHTGQRHGRKDPRYTSKDVALLSSRGIEYRRWSAGDVAEFVGRWSDRCGPWMCVFTSHDLILEYETYFEAAGRYVFAPVSCVQQGMNVRLAGDGPSNWTTRLVTATAEMVWSDDLVCARLRDMPRWGSRNGAYHGPSHDEGENSLDRSKRAVPGGKPLWLMRAIVRDYTRPGDLVCDPCAGGGTTLLAAAVEGRRAIGAELDPETFAKAIKRLERGYTPLLDFGEAAQ